MENYVFDVRPSVLFLKPNLQNAQTSSSSNDLIISASFLDNIYVKLGFFKQTLNHIANT